MPKKKRKRLKELKKIDEQLLDLIVKRCEFLNTYTRNKVSQRESICDPDLEKNLWNRWSKLTSKGIDEKLLRKVFNCLNWMGYELKRESEPWKFMLNPPKIPVDIEILGPKDSIASRFLVIIYGGAKKRFELSGVVLNDSMHELLRSLNLANGDFSWAKDRVVYEGKRSLNFELRPIFVGDDELNLYLMVFLSVATAGKFKFTGGNRLKVLNLDPLFKVLSQLGARGVSLVPYGEGLPIRVEASGMFKNVVVLPEEVDIKLAASLILCSIFYETSEGFIKIVSPFDLNEKRYMQRVFSVFKELGIRFEKNKNEVVVYFDAYKDLPHRVDLFLDPVLSGFVMSFPQAVGGRSVLKGRFPLWLDEARDVMDILLSSDLMIDVFEDRVESTKGEPKPSYFVKSHSSYLIPLSLALGCLCGSEATLKIDSFDSIHLLDELELKYEVREELVYLYNQTQSSFPKVTVSVPEPLWNMALALISFKRPYISINNPGSITDVWPQFWNIFRSLPRCRSWDLEGKEEKTKDESPRRIFVG